MMERNGTQSLDMGATWMSQNRACKTLYLCTTSKTKSMPASSLGGGMMVAMNTKSIEKP
jgi:hypothetical protein